MIDPHSDTLTVGVIGMGAMGQGIAQVALAGGMNVIVHDAREGGAAAGLDQVMARLARLVEKGQMTQSALDTMRAKAGVAAGLQDLAPCHLVVEAVFEDLDLKQSIIAELESVVADDAMIASNTSSILIAAIARKARNKGRIAGLHFFNPVPLMKLVEVVRGPDTGADVVAALVAIGSRMGRTPVVVKDAPGFLVNFGGRAYTTEAMRILHEQVATPAQIDVIMRDCGHFRMGPCELMDLTGVDVNYPVSRIVYQGYDDDPRLKTAFPHKSLLEAGRLGRKTGTGHYTYGADGKMIDPPSGDHVGTAEPTARVVLAQADEALERFCGEIGLATTLTDDHASPILAAPVGEDCTAFATRTGADFRRLVALDLSGDTSKRVTVMTAPGADPAIRDALATRLARSGRKVTAIKDSPGFVCQRIRAMIANLGCEMAQIGIAAPDQIDLAMRLGLNYPLGPLQLAGDMGARETMGILEQMQAITGEDRYRPSQWLRRRALLDLPIHTPD